MDHSTPDPQQRPTYQRVVEVIEITVFAVRWTLLPLYLGLLVALAMYGAHFIHEVVSMAENYLNNVEKQNILLLFLLELLDMVLIYQLGVMTIQGGYSIFIRPLAATSVAPPQWLRHGLSTYDQKIKMGMSIVLIMLVQMLDMYIKMEGFTPKDLIMREQMLACAVGATIAFCVINLLQHPEMLRKKPQDGGH